MKVWSVTRSDLILDTKWGKVRRDTCVTSSGSHMDDYYYWEGGDFAQVLALTEDYRALLVTQYKHGVKEIVCELPAGLISSEDASPLATARRELREETGFEAACWEPLGCLNVSSAKATTKAYPFLATGARQVARPTTDGNEEIKTTAVTVPELLSLITTGKVRDSNSIACTLLALRRLGFDFAASGKEAKWALGRKL